MPFLYIEPRSKVGVDPRIESDTYSWPPRRSKFSRTEVAHITVAVAVLTAAFCMLFRGSSNNPDHFTFRDLVEIDYGGAWVVAFVGIILVITALSFLGHEFGHKFVAQGRGCWSEFRIYPMGLMLTLITSVFGFLIAMPGAVCISGRITDEDNGKISVAGPLVNIVLSLATLLCLQFFNWGVLGAALQITFSLNAILAVFNLIPIGPLDGAKVLRWSTPVWIAMIAIAGMELAAFYLQLYPDITVSRRGIA